MFWAADGILGWNVRAAALEGHPAWKALYYLFCLGCGGLLWFRPKLTRLVGIAESSTNIVLLVVGMMLPYFQLIERLSVGGLPGANESAFTVEKSLSFLASGLIWWVSFQWNLRRR